MVGDTSGVFHSSAGKLRHEYLIVLFEWIFLTKEVLVEDHASFGHVKHQLVVDLVDERFPSVDTHRR